MNEQVMMSKTQNYLLYHCVERIAKVNQADLAIGYTMTSELFPSCIDHASEVSIASELMTPSTQQKLHQHIVDSLLHGPCASKEVYLSEDSLGNHEVLFNQPGINNIRYIPLAEGIAIHAVIVLVNIKPSQITNTPIDVQPFVLATISLLRSRKQQTKVPSLRQTPAAKDVSLVEMMLENTFHPALLFNDEFKVLKSNAAAQRMFHANIERGWLAADKLIGQYFPNHATSILNSISKFSFLGHLENQHWEDIDFEHNSFQCAQVDIQLFAVKYFDTQCFGIMLNEKDAASDQIKGNNANLQRFQALTRVVPLAILQVDPNWHCTYVNETWTRYTGMDLIQSSAKSWLKCLPDDAIHQTLPEIKRLTSQSKEYRGELELTSVAGKRCWTEINVVGLFDERYALSGMIITLNDITEIKKNEKNLQQMANYDHLTGLANRGFFTDRLHVAVTRVKRHGATALMFIDLDKFKQINDTLGHPVGDGVIQTVAQRLNSAVRAEDSVARLGGDEFAIIFTDVQSALVLSTIATKLIDSIHQPFELDGHFIKISCSIGIAISENDGDTAEALLKRADLAVYKAKESGRNQHCFYDSNLEQQALLLGHIKSSLFNQDRRDFSLAFQPQIDARTNDIIGFEALTRWAHPQGHDVGPVEFIKQIEESGLINDFSKWLFNEVVCVTQKWKAMGLLGNKKISLNISARQLHLTKLTDMIMAIFCVNDLTPDHFVLEVTETAIIEEPDVAKVNLTRLQKAGFQIALDDFGTGFSSLSLLRDMPLDYIKIDRAFICHLLSNSNDAKIVKAIVELGNMLNLGVIAEGIEIQEISAWLVKHHCYLHQGYFYHKPLPISQIEQLLINQTSTNNVINICAQGKKVE